MLSMMINTFYFAKIVLYKSLVLSWIHWTVLIGECFPSLDERKKFNWSANSMIVKAANSNNLCVHYESTLSVIFL